MNHGCWGQVVVEILSPLHQSKSISIKNTDFHWKYSLERLKPKLFCDFWLLHIIYFTYLVTSQSWGALITSYVYRSDLSFDLPFVKHLRAFRLGAVNCIRNFAGCWQQTTAYGANFGSQNTVVIHCGEYPLERNVVTAETLRRRTPFPDTIRIQVVAMTTERSVPAAWITPYVLMFFLLRLNCLFIRRYF